MSFSVVVRTADCAAGEHIAARYGVKSDFRQRYDGDGFELTEIKAGATVRHPLDTAEHEH